MEGESSQFILFLWCGFSVFIIYLAISTKKNTFYISYGFNKFTKYLPTLKICSIVTVPIGITYLLCSKAILGAAD